MSSGASRRRRLLVKALVAIGVIALSPVVAILGMALFTTLPAELSATPRAGVVLLDREDRPLHEVRDASGERADWVPLAALGSVVPQALIAAEDARFYDHHGVDPWAVLRAIALDVSERRFASGASTITMQLARTLRPHPRTLFGKLGEAALAVRIERSLSKDRILEEYLNRVDFGPNLRGISAVASAYFDKPPAQLSLAEAALLAGLPQGPSLYAVPKHGDRARRRRDRVLDRMLARGFEEETAVARAKREPVVAQHAAALPSAPHLADALLGRHLDDEQAGLSSITGSAAGVAALATTIDADLQRTVALATAAALRPLANEHVTAASVVVVENATGDILAYVGSPSYFDAASLGANDGVRALRQPGSTLKPFVYAAAIERLGYTAATALPDVELHLELPGGADYAPRDYDGKFRGPVRLREALGSSLNVPAVWTAKELGVDAVLDRLHDFGFASLRGDAADYGPAIALGDGEVTLLELVRAYGVFARNGEDLPLRFVRGARFADGARVVTAEASRRRVLRADIARVITDVLRDPNARRAAFGDGGALRFDYDVAAKTGTSKGFRDNWVVGFSSEVTVGVWVGNFDGSPMRDVSGITGAGPLFHAVMSAAMTRRPGQKLAVSEQDDGLVRTAVCALSGELAGPSCPERVFEWMPEATRDAAATCSFHTEIAIDRRNGLRAGPACADDQRRLRVFETFPSAYDEWALATNRPVAPQLSSPLCPTIDEDDASAGALVRILYPHDGAHFLVDPDRDPDAQAIDVRVAAPPRTTELALLLDGREVSRLGPPFALHAPLAPGEHTLVVTTKGGTASEPVRVSVR